MLTGAISMEKSQSFQNDHKVILVFISCFRSSNSSSNSSCCWFWRSPQGGARSPSSHSLQAKSFRSQSDSYISPLLPPLLHWRKAIVPVPHTTALNKTVVRGEMPPTTLTHLQVWVSAVSESKFPSLCTTSKAFPFNFKSKATINMFPPLNSLFSTYRCMSLMLPAQPVLRLFHFTDFYSSGSQIIGH